MNTRATLYRKMRFAIRCTDLVYDESVGNAETHYITEVQNLAGQCADIAMDHISELERENRELKKQLLNGNTGIK